MVILKVITLIVLMAAALYVGVAQGVRRFAALTLAPESMHADLQFWGFVYLSIGALLFTTACTLAFVWLAQSLHKRK